MSRGSFLEDAFWSARDEVESYLAGVPGVLYSSSDVRDSGFRASTVDVNVFPAGFNNLPSCEEASRLLRRYLEDELSGAERVGIYPESHTRNRYYVENLCSLRDVARGAGFEAEVVTTDPTLLEGDAELDGADGCSVTYVPLEDFDPDVVILNNDLSDGPIEGLDDAEVVPPQSMGWWNRSKGRFFELLEEEASGLADAAGIDPWRICPRTVRIDDVDLEGDLEEVALAVEDVLDYSREKHTEHGVEGEVAAFVKDDRGTYGRGTTMVGTGDAVRDMSNGDRKSMAIGKGGRAVTSVVVQEGIPTRHKVGGESAEPVQYVVGGESVGYFWRCRGDEELSVLNSPGQSFRSDPELPERTRYLHEAVARLGDRAAGRQARGQTASGSKKSLQ